MSVDNSTNKVQYTLSSATQTLPVPFYFLDAGDLKVIKAGTADTVLILNTDYTVSGAGDEDGGSVILTGTDTAIADLITVKREVALTQLVDYVENGAFPSETHEQVVDRLTMAAQQLDEKQTRSITVPETEPSSTVLVLPSKSDRASTVMAFDENGDLSTIPDSDSAIAQSAASAAAAAASAAAATDLYSGGDTDEMLVGAGVGTPAVWTEATGTGAPVRKTSPTIETPNIVGTATNNNAADGSFGEYKESVVSIASAVSLTSGNPANVTSLSLTAGDWDISGIVTFINGGSTTVRYWIGALSTVSATLSSINAQGQAAISYPGSVPGTNQCGLVIPTTRLSLAATTTIYLVAQSGFEISTMVASGAIRARRRR